MARYNVRGYVMLGFAESIEALNTNEALIKAEQRLQKLMADTFRFLKDEAPNLASSYDSGKSGHEITEVTKV